MGKEKLTHSLIYSSETHWFTCEAGIQLAAVLYPSVLNTLYMLVSLVRKCFDINKRTLVLILQSLTHFHGSFLSQAYICLWYQNQHFMYHELYLIEKICMSFVEFHFPKLLIHVLKYFLYLPIFSPLFLISDILRVAYFLATSHLSL